MVGKMILFIIPLLIIYNYNFIAQLYRMIVLFYLPCKYLYIYIPLRRCWGKIRARGRYFLRGGGKWAFGKWKETVRVGTRLVRSQ